MTQPDGLGFPQRIWAITTIGLGITMAVIDSAIANVALPTIAIDLHTDAAFSIWIVNGYQLAITISLLPLSALGDILGYRRIYLAGLALFTLASLACAFSHTLGELQSVACHSGFWRRRDHERQHCACALYLSAQGDLGRGIGINAVIVVDLGGSWGRPLRRGPFWRYRTGRGCSQSMCRSGSWRSLVELERSLPQSPRAKHRFDFISAILSAITFGPSDRQHRRARDMAKPFVLFLAEMVATLCLSVIWLVKRQLALPSPLLPIDLMRIPIFALSVGTSVSSFAAQMLALVSLPFLLQLDLHFSAIQTGLFITPWPIAIGITAPIAGRLADRHSAGLLGGIGLVVFAAGLLSLAFLPPHPSHFDIVWRMALSGIGFGFFQSPNNRAMIGAAPRERSGGASGMLGSARLLGQARGPPSWRCCSRACRKARPPFRSSSPPDLR